MITLDSKAKPKGRDGITSSVSDPFLDTTPQRPAFNTYASTPSKVGSATPGGEPANMSNFTLAQAIGSDLITEVRRLNTLLNERDKALKETNVKLSELEKAHETMKTQLRSDEIEKGKSRTRRW